MKTSVVKGGTTDVGFRGSQNPGRRKAMLDMLVKEYALKSLSLAWGILGFRKIRTCTF
jgi:hypothetical protein